MSQKVYSKIEQGPVQQGLESYIVTIAPDLAQEDPMVRATLLIHPLDRQYAAAIVTDVYLGADIGDWTELELMIATAVTFDTSGPNHFRRMYGYQNDVVEAIEGLGRLINALPVDYTVHPQYQLVNTAVLQMAGQEMASHGKAVLADLSANEPEPETPAPPEERVFVISRPENFALLVPATSPALGQTLLAEYFIHEREDESVDIEFQWAHSSGLEREEAGILLKAVLRSLKATYGDKGNVFMSLELHGQIEKDGALPDLIADGEFDGEDRFVVKWNDIELDTWLSQTNIWLRAE